MQIFQKLVVVIVVSMVLSAWLVSPEIQAQTTAPEMKGTMTFTAEIDKVRGNYVVRADKPAEVFTVLNPDPKILDDLINQGKPVFMEVQIVSGDNVNITTINGQIYYGVAP